MNRIIAGDTPAQILAGAEGHTDLDRAAAFIEQQRAQYPNATVTLSPHDADAFLRLRESHADLLASLSALMDVLDDGRDESALVNARAAVAKAAA